MRKYIALGLLICGLASAQTPNFISPSNAPLGTFATLGALEAQYPSGALPIQGGPTAFINDGTTGMVQWNGSTWVTVSPTAGSVTPSSVTSFANKTISGASNTITGVDFTNSVYLSALSNGALFDDSHDDSSALNTALAVCTLSARCFSGFPPGLTAKINTGLTITSGVNALDGNGLTLDASGMTTNCVSAGSGCYAILVTPASGTVGGYPSNEFSQVMPIANIRLLGPKSSASTVDGIGFVGATQALSDLKVNNYRVIGFRDGVGFGSNAYIIGSDGCHISGNWRSGVNFYGSVTAGENINFHSCDISGNNGSNSITFTGSITSGAGSATLNANWTLPTGAYLVLFSDGEIIPTTLTNGATTAAFATTISNNATSSAATVAAGMWLENTEGGSKDIYCDALSLDYNDVAIVNLGGMVKCSGHTEDNHNANPLMVIVQNSGSQPTGVYWDGAVSLTDVSPRTSMINISGGFPKSFFKSRARWNLSSIQTQMLLVEVGTPMVDIQGSQIDFFGSSSSNWPSLGPLLNTLVNPGFELASLNGWTSSGTSWTWTADTGIPHSGTYAAKGVSTGTNSGQIYQAQACWPGQQVIYTAWVDVTAISNGHINLNINFLDKTGLVTVSTNTEQTFSGTTGGYTVVHGYETCPAGAAVAELALGGPSGGSGFTGTVYLDDAYLETN